MKTFISWFLMLPAILFLLNLNSFERNTFSKTVCSHCMDHSSDDIQFEQEVVYSEPGEIMFGSITSSAVDPSGRVFMGDGDQKMIHIFSPGGSYLHSFGSQGNGPGEFQMISKIAIDEDHIHVFDLIQARINIFDTKSFDFIRTIALSENGGVVRRGTKAGESLGRPFDFHLFTDGNYLVSYRSFMDINRPRTAIVSPEGEVLEKDQFEIRAAENEFSESSSGRQVIATFPFSRTTQLTVSPNGMVYSNWSEDLEFDQYDDSGTQLQSFSYPHQNVAIDRNELLKMYENVQTQRVVVGSGGSGSGPLAMQQVLENMELPDTWPAVDNIYADTQNRLWVEAFTDNTNERKWFLFTEAGDLMGTFTWPSSRSVIHTGQNTVYAQDRKVDELDRVVRYRFTTGD